MILVKDVTNFFTCFLDIETRPTKYILKQRH